MKKETALDVKFWAPYTVPYDEADNSVVIKAPEERNKEKRARNQSIARTRAGNVYVYDRGNNYNTNFSLEFKDILDVERAQLIVFLEAIQWATTKICYQDMYGDIYIVRCLQENGIEWEDLGTDLKKGLSRIRWNFSLDLLNLTDNLSELSIADGTVSNALTLHINNFNDPHNPEICTTVNDADGAKIIEEFNCVDWRTVVWTVLISKEGLSTTYLISGTHNRETLADDADSVEVQKALVVELGDVSSHAVLDVSLNGTGVGQKMRLTCNMNSDGWKVCIRRMKIGAGL